MRILRDVLDAATRPSVLALAFVVVLAMLAAPAGVAGGAATDAANNTTATVQQVDSCRTISSSGTYELTSDVTATDDESCIQVTASNVTIDGNGYTIHGYDNNTFQNDGDPQYVNGSTGINVTGSLGAHTENVTIRNVTIEDGNVGISGHYAHDLTLEDVTVDDTDAEAITTFRTNGTVALHDVTVTESATWVTTEDGEYVGEVTDPAIDIGVTGAGTSNNDLHVDEVIISNLTATDNGHATGSDDSTVDVYAAGPVTVEDSVVERSAGGGMTLESVPLGYGSLDVTVTNVTVSDFNRLPGIDDPYDEGGPGIYVYADSEATVRNSTVTDGQYDGQGFDVSGEWSVAFTNNTVRDVEVEDDDDAGVHVSHGNDVTVRDVRVADTGNGTGLTASGQRVTVEDVAVNGTADVSGWGADLTGSDELTVRNVSVWDSGDGGLQIDGHEQIDARNLSVRDVRFQEDGIDDPFEHGEGLIVQGYDGTVRDVEVVDTAGGVRVVEDRTDSPTSYPPLAVENLTVTNTSHHGIDVRGDDVELREVVVVNTSKTGVVKRPETFGSTVNPFGEFVVQDLTVEDAGTDGVAARLADDGLSNGPNDNVTLTNVDVVDSGDSGVEFHHVTTSSLEDVSVVNASGTDLNLTEASASLDDATLAGTRFDGRAENVTVELVEQGDTRALPDSTSGVGVYFEANDTRQDGYLNATLHYDDSDVPSSLDESTLQFWRDDGTRWSAVNGTVDPAAATVSKNVTYFSTFALLGTDGTPDPAENFTVEVTDTDDPVWKNVPLTVTAEVTNERASQGAQEIQLLDFDGTVVDSQQVTVDSGSTTSVDLEWTMENSTADTRELAVRSEHGWDTADVEMSPIAGQSILGCAVVTEPGSYELARNLATGGDQPCIVVQSSDVTIDGQGLEVTGPSGADSDERGTAVVVDGGDDPVENVTVRNLTVENVTSVIELDAEVEPVSDVTIRNVSAPSVASGIDASGEFDGLAVRDSNFTVSGDPRGEGIAIQADGDNTEVRNVSVSNVTIRNQAGATTRGVEVDLGDDDVTFDGFEVSDSTIHTEDEPVAVTGPLSDHIGDDTVVQNVTVADNDLDSATDPAITVEYANRDTVVESLRIEDNVVRADDNDPGIELVGNDYGTKTRDVVVTGNDIARADHGVYANLENGYEELHGLEVSNNSISADSHAVYVGGTDGTSDPTVRDVDVRNNSISGGDTGIQLWLSGGGVTSEDVSIADNDVSDVRLGLDVLVGEPDSTHEDTTIQNNTVSATDEGILLDFFGADVAYDATVRENNITDFATTGVILEVQADPDADLEFAENNVTNDQATVTGLAVQTASSNATGNGTLAVTRNTVRTGGDAVVINEDTPGDVPVDSLDISYNVLDASGYGVRNYNTASDGQGRAWVNATNNYWNASDGPGSAGPYEDPVTGTLADGSGASVSNGSDAEVANVHFDPHLSSATPDLFFVDIESTTAPVTEGGSLSVDVTIENAGEESSTRTVALSTAGVERDSTDVTLDAGEATTETLAWSTEFGDAGDYTATVESGNDSASVPVSVDPSTGNFSVTLDSTNEPVSEDESLTVNATVENVGDLRGAQPVNLSVDGTERTASTPTLASGDSTELTFTWQTGPGDAGSHNVSVASGNDSASTAVTVEQRYEIEYGVDRTYQQMAGASYFEDVTATSDSGYVAVGTTESGEYQASTNASIVKVDDGGNEVWNRTPNSSVDESFAAVVETDDGGYLAVGSRAHHGNPKAWAVRYESDGTVRWNKTYAASEEKVTFTDVASTSDGDFAVAGSRTTQTSGGWENGWVSKLNESGTVEWERTLGSDQNRESFSSLARTSDGGYVVTGFCASCSDEVASRHLIVKLGTDGATEWNTTFGSEHMSEDTQAVRRTDDGGYVVAGSAVRAESGAREDGWLVKFDSSGVQQWQRNYYPDDDSYEQFNDVRQLPNGDFVLVGRTDGVGDGFSSDDDAWIMRVDDRGYERTNWTIPTDRDDAFTGMVATENTEEVGVVGRSEAWTQDYAGWLLEVDLAVPTDAEVSVTGTDSNAPVSAGDTLDVTATVENTGGQEVDQTVALSVDGTQRDTTTVTLPAGESDSVTLSWDTATDDAGDYTATVTAGGSTDSTQVSVEEVTGTIDGTVTDAENGTGLDNATVDVRDDETLVTVTSTTTTADGSYTVDVAVGDYDVRVQAPGYVPEERVVTVNEDATTTEAFELSPVDDGDGGENDTADNATVVATSVTHVGGTQPDLSNVSLSTSVFEGVQLTLRNDTADSDAPPWAASRFELAGHGADATTELELEAQVENFDPRILAGAGNVTDWQVTENGDGTSNVTVRVRPVNVERIVDCEQYGDTCTPSMENWPTGDDDQANVSMDAAASLGLYNGSGQPSGTAATLNGTEFTSNAQFQDPPEYVPGTAEQPPRLVLSVAGPHYATDGDVTDGAATAFLPGDLLDEWNVTDSDQLTVTYRGNATSFDAESAGDGLWLTADLTYSAGDVVISPSGDDGGETDESAPVVESLTVDGTDVTGDAPVYVNESTASVAATYSDTGTGIDADAVELTVGSSTKPLDSVDSSGLDTDVALSDGTRTVELLVVDNAGNERRVDGTVVVDTAAPAVDLTVSRTDHVSENQPVEIEAASSDENAGETTVVVENASAGTEVANWTVTGDVADGTAIRTWNATDVDGTPVSSGAYDVTVESVDAAGNANSTTTPVAVDNSDPTATVTAVGVNDSAATPPSGQTVHTNGTVSFELSADGTPGDAADVSVVLESTSTNFGHEVDANHSTGTTWTATTDLSTLPDDGRYDVVVAATDPAGNENESTADATVRLDREAPDLAATVTQFDANTGRVNVTTSDMLDGDPTIEVEKPDGTTETATIEDSGTGYWNASFNLTEDGGQYNVTVTGTDRAGNRGTDTASTVVNSVETENNSETVVLEPSGLFVNFTTNQSVTDTVVMTESETPLAPLTAGNAGVNFLDAQLGDHIAGNLSHAVIGIPVDMDAVPGSVEKNSVEIRYYNETTNTWEQEDTTVEERTVLNESREYWVANVTHFSTYGAVASDDTAPTVDHASPSGELAAGETNSTVRFEYSDDVSGVNASEVSLSFDGGPVTTEDATAITSEYATYDATGLSPGSYDATVTVVDEAGNDAERDTTFTVRAADDDDDDDVGSVAPGSPDYGGDTGTPGATVSPRDGGGVAVEITNVDANQTAAVQFDPIDTGGASFDGLALSFASEQNAVDVEVRPSAGAPDGVPALDATDAVGYVEVEHDAPRAAVEGAAFQFEVSSAALPEGASLDDVALYRYHGGDWNALDTNRNGTEFEAESPGLSAFAIGVDRPAASLDVTGVDLSATSVEPGESVTVTATVANDGDASGDTELSVSVDGETVQTETVSVDAGESTEVTVTHAFEDAGSYEIEVASEVAGTVVVEQATTTTEAASTDEPANRSTTTESGDTGGGVPGFGALLAVVAFLAAALVAVGRRR